MTIQHRVLVLCMTAFCGLTKILLAAELPWKEGDTVYVLQGASHVAATVIDVPDGKAVNVRYNKSRKVESVDAQWILKAEKGYVLAAAETKLNPGDKVKSPFGFVWQAAKVLEVNDDGTVKIRIDLGGDERTVPRGMLELREDAAAAASPKKASASPLAGKRTWTDASGKFKLEATFQGLADGKVSLQKPDGAMITLPLEKLSEADREIANFLASQSAPALEPQKDDENPFGLPTPKSEKKGKAVASNRSSSESKPKPAEPESKENWSEVIELSLRSAGSFQIPPQAAAAPQPKLADRPITLSESQDKFWEGPSDVLFSPNDKFAVVLHKSRSPGSKKPYRFDLCDLEAGKLIGSFSFPDIHRPVAISPSGTRLVTYTNWWVNRPPHADLWEIDASAGEIKHLVRWKAVDSKEHHPPDIRAGQYVDETHVLLYDTARLTLWNLEKDPTAVYAAGSRDPAADPGLTPSGKHLLTVLGNSVGLFDALTGSALGAIELPGDLLHPRLSPDGSKVAVLGRLTLRILDVKSGKILEDFPLPDGVKGNMLWADNRFLLFDSTHLVDTELGIIAWRYDRPTLKGADGPSPLRYAAGRFWFIAPGSGGGRPNLVSMTLPHPAAKEVVAGLDRQKLAVFQPGAKVTLKLDLPTLNEEQRSKATAALTKSLEEAGVTVGENGDLVLEGTSSQGKPQAVQFEKDRFPLRAGATTAAVFTPNAYKLRILDKNVEIWSKSHVTISPGAIFLQAGETVETVMERHSRPSPDFFINTKFPKRLMRPGPHQGAYGTSKL